MCSLILKPISFLSGAKTSKLVPLADGSLDCRPRKKGAKNGTEPEMVPSAACKRGMVVLLSYTVELTSTGTYLLRVECSCPGLT